MRTVAASVLTVMIVTGSCLAGPLPLLQAGGKSSGGGAGGFCNGDNSTIPSAALTSHMDSSSAAWVQTAITSVTAGQPDPNGGTTASLVQTNEGSGGVHDVAHNPWAIGATQVVQAVFCVKASTNVHWLTLYMIMPSTASSGITFDATDSSPAGTVLTPTGTICENFGEGTDCSSQIVAEGSGWFRVAIKRTSGGAGNGNFGVASTISATPLSFSYPDSYFIGSPNFFFFVTP